MTNIDVKQRLIQMADGTLVERDTLRIAEKIREYDPNLRLKYCNAPTSITDAPYMLTEVCRDGIERKVFDIWELDDRVIQQLYAADTKYVDVQAMIDKNNAQVKADENRRYRELQEEATEIAHAIFTSPKDTYKVNDPFTGKKLKVHASRPVEVLDNGNNS